MKAQKVLSTGGNRVLLVYNDVMGIYKLMQDIRYQGRCHQLFSTQEEPALLLSERILNEMTKPSGLK